MAEHIRYVHLQPEDDLPVLQMQCPFRAVLVLEESIGAFWQASVSQWLVESGCLYALAVGVGCSSWDDSIDIANLEKFDYGDIPEDQAVTTTWHEDETLPEVFSFSKHHALHPTQLLQSTVLVHIATAPREAKLLAAYADA